MSLRFITSALQSWRKKSSGDKPLADRRTLFRDLSLGSRTARTNILQLYSAAPNIGNYLPVAAIHQMMGQSLDCWNVHDPQMDYEFINRNYRAIIIGGAGLLHPVFASFWRRFADECRLPFVVWGVGGCFPDGDKNRVPLEIVKPTLPRCLACNVRDELTASMFGFANASITPCPTILYVADKFRPAMSGGNLILFADHAELTGPELSATLQQRLEKKFGSALRHTDNTQTQTLGMDDILETLYAPSRLVVTTRLHGAIIAYGLKIPYVALATDEKLRAFGSTFGNGLVSNSLSELADALDAIHQVKMLPPDYESVRAFGREARSRLEAV